MCSDFGREHSHRQVNSLNSSPRSAPQAAESKAGQAPPLSLPRGGGALRGIDEKFTVNSVNGTNSLSVPVPFAPARGLAPALALTYSSGFGNGPFGLGWMLGVPAIKRKTERELPRYLDDVNSDTFILSDAEDLAPLLKQNPASGEWEPQVRETAEHYVTQFRPRIEGLWARIEQWKRKDTGAIHWRTISPDNSTSLYGPDDDSRLADPADPTTRIFEWRLSHTFDDKGNLIVYRYKREDFAGVPNATFERNRNAGNCTNLYLKKVLHGNKTPYQGGADLPPESDFLFVTVFDYGEHDQATPSPEPDDTWVVRSDAFSSFRAGFDIRTYRICRRALLFHKFDELPVNPYLVTALELTYEDFPGAQPSEDHLEGFTYLKSITQRGYLYDSASGQYTSKTLPPVNYRYQHHEWNTEVKQLSTEDAYNAPIGIDFESYRWVDLYSEGLSGILSEQSDAWYFKRNLGNGDFTAATQVTPKPSLAGVATGALQLQDLGGVGDQYLVNWSAEPKGFFRLDDEEGWLPFRAFDHAPTRNPITDPYTRLLDLNGDGVADLLITEDECLAWHESKGERGFGEAHRLPMPQNEEQGPRVVFADPEQTVFVADMTGDGLQDIVRVRNGEVCYWANLGYGRFSMKVTMEDAPRFDRDDSFNPAYLRFADIDGSGTADLVYLGQGDFRVWLNLNGNGWTRQPKVIAPFPAVDNRADISMLDLLGTGTACVVWSSPLPADANAPLRYVDLMSSKKPHLLNFYENNMGKEVSFGFLPSTHFYLEDMKRGRPWATKLPFPIHVVAQVRIEDKVRETVFTSSYTYHHGYFDGKEREFRGFGRVTQLDTEQFSTFRLNTAQNVVEHDHHQPPVRTVTWFHTGAALNKRLLTDIYRDEFYQNTALPEHALPASSIPADLSTQEWCEALRACKGLMLRGEVYADDGSDREAHPYSVNEATYDIQLVQPQSDQKHAVFLVVPKESISHSYDRNPRDPRVSHSLVLETDDKGMVTKSASVVYPRTQRPADIPDEVWLAQARRHVIYSESEFTDDIDSDDEYRIRANFESRSYELLGIPGLDDQFLTTQSLLSNAQGAATIPFEDDGNGSLQKRLISHSRLYFLRNDLNGGLALGQRESLGLVFRSLQLALTDGLVARHYGGKVTAGMLSQARYEHSEGDNDWWVPSGISLFAANAEDLFFAPTGARDALGSETRWTFDQYVLLNEGSVDAVGNTVTVENDYRTLSPHMITDPNLNRSAIETDELGQVIKTAVMGKSGVGEGDTLVDPTARIEYDFFNWLNNGRPNYVHTFAREQHGAGNARWRETYVYSDGGGGSIVSKSQAEPGKAKRWNPDTQEVEEIETADRWVGNGRVILNNKGDPIKQYEPYFSATHEYEHEPELVERGVTPILYYDPLGRNIRSDLPSGTFSRVEFNPWHSKHFDTNDTVQDSRWYLDRGRPDPLTDPEPNDPEQRAAWLAAKHHDTPATVHTDSTGRIVYAVADHGNGKATAVRHETDLAGRFAMIFDELDRRVSSGYASLLGATIYGEGAEKGENWIFQDVMRRIVKLWDNDLREIRTTYDALHRPVSSFVREDGSETLFNHIVYGETHANAQSRNLRGLAYQVYDQAGVMTVEEVDFKGNILNVTRRLAREYKQTVDWKALDGLTDVVAIANAADPLLELEVFAGTSTFDALNRPVEATLPDGTILRPNYNEGGYLDSLEAQIGGQGGFITFLENQDYNARGQREWAKYGNGSVTKYFYDPNTFRLTNLLTTARESDAPSSSLQNIKYTFDPVGNMTQVVDDAQQTHFFRNNVVRPEHRYEYDAIYQLIKASGREHAGLGGNAQRTHFDIPFIAQLPHSNDATAVRTYTETYEYDDLGNIRELRHVTPDSQSTWTRRYRYEHDYDSSNRTNRLASNSMPGDPAAGPYSATYGYDLHGNMTTMPHLQQMSSNFLDQLRVVDLGGGGTAYYVYGGSGNRRRKVIERTGGRRIERIYLGAVEIYRERRGDNPPDLERWTVHISDDSGRIAQVDTKTIDTANADAANPLNSPLVRFQYTNHLGSAVLETDLDANVVSYEEYHPFGTTAYHSSKHDVDLSLKRYRFSGKERDDETGLYYFGARYCAVWLGRWTSADPAGFASSFNLFRFCSNNPIRFKDPNGKQEEDRWFGLPEADANVPENATQRQVNQRAQRLQQHVHGLGYRWTRDGAQNPNPTYSRESNTWRFGMFDPEQIPEGDPLGLLGRPPEAPTDTSGGSGPPAPAQSSTPSADNPSPRGPSTSGDTAPAADPGGGDWTRWGAQLANYLGADFVQAGAVRLADNAAKAGFAQRAGAIIDNLDEAYRSLDNLQRIAKGAFDARQGSRAASQARLLPLSRAWSRFTETARTFGGEVTKRLGQTGGDLAEAYREVAVGAGKGRGAATTTAARAGVFGRFLGVAGIGLSAYSLYADLSTENYGVVLGDVAGIVAGGYVVAGAALTPAGLAASGVALANVGGDLVGGYVEEKTGSRAAGAAAGTITGAATGAAFGAAIGTLVPVVGTLLGAGVGAVVGGIAGFIGAYW